jgi:hypothetical protein
VIDHTAEAVAHGLELRDKKLVVFGNPLTGTPAMAGQSSRGTRSDKHQLPEPLELASRYGLSAELARALTGTRRVTEVVLTRS